MTDQNVLIVNRTYVIERFEGKGGWHYVLLEEDLKPYKSSFGWVKVKGKVDKHTIEGIKLAPYGKGKSMFTFNAEIRKAIGKGQGDKVKLELYIDTSVAEVPAEIVEILSYYSEAQKFFDSLTESQKRFFTDYVAEAKTDETKVARINMMLDKLLEKRKFYD
jgi:tRNA isopentenyl-2-thiomethyl-A-37 hydroxylase MiaE